MVTQLQQSPTHSIKLEFGDEPVTALGGMVLPERVARRLRLWSSLGGALPARRGYAWGTIVKSLVCGLLSGGQGTFAAEELRQDPALRALLGLEAVPEEATVWRALGQLGRNEQWLATLDGLLARWARRVLSAALRAQLLVEGFVPVFCDGTLLEGSARREGTKWLRDKGHGLMWSAAFVGPVLAAQELAREGQGEVSGVRRLIERVDDQVLGPCKLRRRALVMMDGLHGHDPTLALLEARGLHYVVGASNLQTAHDTLAALPEAAWRRVAPREGWDANAVCTCWVQCEDWPAKRLLVGRRWRKAGEMIDNYRGVLTNLDERDVAALMQRRGLGFAETIWRLYDLKGGCERHFEDVLGGLGLHRPPCGRLAPNAAFYAVGALAHVLGVATTLMGAAATGRAEAKPTRSGRAKTGKPARATARMRLWRLRRRMLMVPAHVVRHGRTMTVRVLGLTRERQAQFEQFFVAACRC